MLQMWHFALLPYFLEIIVAVVSSEMFIMFIGSGVWCCHKDDKLNYPNSKDQLSLYKISFVGIWKWLQVY